MCCCLCHKAADYIYVHLFLFSGLLVSMSLHLHLVSGSANPLFFEIASTVLSGCDFDSDFIKSDICIPYWILQTIIILITSICLFIILWRFCGGRDLTHLVERYIYSYFLMFKMLSNLYFGWYKGMPLFCFVFLHIFLLSSVCSKFIGIFFSCRFFWIVYICSYITCTMTPFFIAVCLLCFLKFIYSFISS